jgi:hypothetical protein
MDEIKVGDTFYRYEDSLYGTGDPEVGDWGTHVEIDLREYCVVKVTPKGCWINYWPEKSKFVLSGTNKKYAAPTKQLAMWSFMARKRKQKKILEAQLLRVNSAIRRADQMNAGVAA